MLFKGKHQIHETTTISTTKKKSGRHGIQKSEVENRRKGGDDQRGEEGKRAGGRRYQKGQHEITIPIRVTYCSLPKGGK